MGKERAPQKLAEIRRETENRVDYFFPWMSVTLPWESKATGEPDFAELRLSLPTSPRRGSHLLVEQLNR